MPNEKLAKFEMHLQFIWISCEKDMTFNVRLRFKICQLHFALCVGVSKYVILHKFVELKISFLLCFMKMEEQAKVLEKVSWSIDMKQWFDCELSKMRVNAAKNSIFLTETTYRVATQMGECNSLTLP